MEEVQAKVIELNAEIERRCDELGVRPELRPRQLNMFHSSPRLSRDRQIEVRRLARAELDAAGKRAKTEIDRQTAAVCAEVIVAGISSPEAQALLNRVPSVESLVPPLAVQEIEAKARRGDDR